jgi:hypothetical protein
MRSVLNLVTALAVALAGCATVEPAPPPPPPPIRIAVIAAPEVGGDPAALAALQAAMTRVTVTRGLGFVLVPGPLLAHEATKESLEDLKSTLDYATVPLYISFAPSGTGAPPPADGAPTAEEVLAALESRGPGAGHRISFRVQPATVPDTSVIALAPDGSPPAEPAPPKNALTVALAAQGVEPSKDVVAGLVVRAVSGREFGLALEEGRVIVRAPSVKTASLLGIVTCDRGQVSLEVLPLDLKGKATTTLGPLPLAQVARGNSQR